MNERISVCLPVYNGAETILDTIHSILSQSLKDFELVVVDNASTDNTVDFVKSVKDDRIKLYRNTSNIGCGANLGECKNKATGDILFYICSDDIADVDALRKASEAFMLSEEIGIVIRPYYWFNEDVCRAVRATKQFSQTQVISLNDDYGKIRDVIALSDQISGVALRRRYMDFSFKNDRFVEMASAVLPMLKICKAAILKDNIVAIRINKSGALNPAVYKSSPMLNWYNLITEALYEDKFKGIKKFLIYQFVARNYIGLVQIKNYGGYKALFREIYNLIKLRWINILDFRFWLFSLGTIVIPRFILRKLVVIYKNKFNTRFLKNINIKLGGAI